MVDKWAWVGVGDLAHVLQRTCENGVGVLDRDIPAGEREGARTGFVQSKPLEPAVRIHLSRVSRTQRFLPASASHFSSGVPLGK